MAVLTEIEVSATPPAAADPPAENVVNADAAPVEAPPAVEGVVPTDPAIADGAPASPPPAPAEFNPISVPEGPRESSVKWEGVRRAPSDFDRLKSGNSRERDR